jgi:hypothetical protein
MFGRLKGFKIIKELIAVANDLDAKRLFQRSRLS